MFRTSLTGLRRHAPCNRRARPPRSCDLRIQRGLAAPASNVADPCRTHELIRGRSAIWCSTCIRRAGECGTAALPEHPQLRPCLRSHGIRDAGSVETGHGRRAVGWNAADTRSVQLHQRTGPANDWLDAARSIAQTSSVNPAGRSRERAMVSLGVDGRSSNGRTRAFGARCGGSNPPRPTKP